MRGFTAAALGLASSHAAVQAEHGDCPTGTPSLGHCLARHGALWGLLLDPGTGASAGATGAAKSITGGRQLFDLVDAAAVSPAQVRGCLPFSLGFVWGGR